MKQYQRNWKDYYEILQVSPHAEPEVITSAYRRLAQKYHPDATKDSAVSTRMVELNEAYEVLSNSSKRADYDLEFQRRHSSQEQVKYEHVSKRRYPLTKQEIKTALRNRDALKLARDGLFMLIGGGIFMGISYMVFGKIGLGWFAVILLVAGVVNVVRGLYTSLKS